MQTSNYDKATIEQCFKKSKETATCYKDVSPLQWFKKFKFDSFIKRLEFQKYSQISIIYVNRQIE